MYGNQPKTPAEKQADQKFIETVTKAAGTREKAAGRMIQRGWEFLSRGDLSTAMKRFNQAWLLTPDDMNVYWGFGAVLSSNGQANEAILMFEKAVSMAPNNPRLLSDVARTYAMQGNYAKAGEFVHKAQAIDPQVVDAQLLKGLISKMPEPVAAQPAAAPDASRR
jgi:Tfp pilus assembly protein PilF